MKDSRLIKICLSISIIGLILLSIYAEKTDPPEINLNEMEEYLGKTVITEGIVEKISVRPEVSFITLRDGEFRTTVVTFDPITTDIRKSNRILVAGQVKIYKGELEIIADRIERNE
jgi:aspartyl/asparaginyl-tRNA synthetase